MDIEFTETNEGTGHDAGPDDSILRGDSGGTVPHLPRHRVGCPTAQAVSQDRLLELLLEKGRHISTTVVPPGYVITDDGRDPDVHQVTERSAWDKKHVH